jgi:hypothetical protein
MLRKVTAIMHSYDGLNGSRACVVGGCVGEVEEMAVLIMMRMRMRVG